ncbi:SusD family [Proteiniphilum saccharofermentans]|uniref:SusD family n=1 Tax=Proteiniphilum saccharofermentans TaxID=1642647 RepID=A0A1R3SZB0_9BACT|nr:RagB/SusD family nutrient uptake outer membrane protein [Proteiniphilum saccharofermentans]SCD21513.1 SusD family [Proteiniphilum saccharofermentans]SDZ84385.1 Starch-binding associating with outer membrane [Porphyromonadaceae bacterium KH3R12]SFS91257.1 Starch-binding associating with outer membrane [Porphyromonadaceae bacterium NLAE-zl-C104]
MKRVLMKIIISKILISICILTFLLSCSDQFLQDKRDYNNLTTLDVYSDPEQAKAVFGTIYKQILERYNSPFCGSDPLMRQAQNTGGLQHIYTEELSDGGFRDGRYNGSNGKNTKAGNHIANPPYWNDPRSSSSNYNNFNRYTLFPTVFLINNFIIEIDRSRDLYNNDTFWDQLKGQAIFARAWLYFDAVRLWGGVPYYATDTDQPQPGDRSLRMPIQDCIDKICDDFQAAAELLPAVWDADNDGRFTSVAALAMISRVRVYAASPVFNANWDDPGSRRWQAALDASLAAEAAANTAGYGSSISDIESWDRAFYAYNGMFNPEAIIKIPKSDNVIAGAFNRWEQYVRPGAVISGTNAGMPAPDEVLMKFPMRNGRAAIEENGYNNEKFYRNRDPRFYRTFAFSGCEWPGTNTQIWLYTYKYSTSENQMYRYTDGSRGDGGAQKKSRAIVWKMSDPNVPIGGESTSGTDILEYRYAEILLNIAEAYAAKGDVGGAISYLSKIRSRVGVDAANNYGLNDITDKYSAIRTVLNERAVELAYEGKRSWDMRRWLLYEGGAGFDPRLADFDDGTRFYTPDLAWGKGWRIYDGKDGRPNYTKESNVLTKLGLPRFAGTKHSSKLWAYDIDNVYPVDEWNPNEGVIDHPLKTDERLLAVSPISRNMTESQRDAAFDKLDAFYDGVGMETVNPIQDSRMGHKYAMDSGTNVTDQNFLFAWRGWYYVYPIHYDMYTPGKGNDWIEQTAGWMTANANPTGLGPEEQDGTYYYCTPE